MTDHDLDDLLNLIFPAFTEHLFWKNHGRVWLTYVYNGKDLVIEVRLGCIHFHSLVLETAWAWRAGHCRYSALTQGVWSVSRPGALHSLPAKDFAISLKEITTLYLHTKSFIPLHQQNASIKWIMIMVSLRITRITNSFFYPNSKVPLHHKMMLPCITDISMWIEHRNIWSLPLC